MESPVDEICKAETAIHNPVSLKNLWKLLSSYPLPPLAGASGSAVPDRSCP